MLPCQLDSALLTLDTTVLRCEPRPDGAFAVVLARTPFYPEGGGQPADHGHIGEARVLDVQTVGGEVVHTTDAAVAGAVTAQVDPERRTDHTQQHSAQHLLTACFEDGFGAATVGFHLGETTTTIDLDRDLPAAAVRAAMDRANALIREARPVRAEVVSLEEYAARDVRSRGLPEGFTGDVRLVGIEGVDLNTCGGTHVRTTAELQVIVVVRTERYKGGLRVHFLAGERARRAQEAALAREAALSKALTAGVDDHVPAVKKLLDQAKSGAKARKALLRELGTLLGAELARGERNPVHLHRDEADPGLLKAIADTATAARPELRMLLTGGEPKGPGVFLVAGPDAAVSAAGPDIAAALQGRGGGRGGRFQGKAQDLSGTPAALAALSG
jgi:Ser-tRNA(Ala) deacylase AlaX